MSKYTWEIVHANGSVQIPQDLPCKSDGDSHHTVHSLNLMVQTDLARDFIMIFIGRFSKELLHAS